jgi:hypothetical protein
LAASPVDSAEAEVRWVWRHNAIAFEPPPLGRPARQVPQHRAVPSDLNIRCSVHDYFDRALAPVAMTAASQHRPALGALGIGHPRRCRECCCYYEKPSVHFISHDRFCWSDFQRL